MVYGRDSKADVTRFILLFMGSELNGRLSALASPHPSRKSNTTGKRLEIRALRQKILGFVAKLILRIS